MQQKRSKFFNVEQSVRGKTYNSFGSNFCEKNVIFGSFLRGLKRKIQLFTTSFANHKCRRVKGQPQQVTTKQEIIQEFF